MTLKYYKILSATLLISYSYGIVTPSLAGRTVAVENNEPDSSSSTHVNRVQRNNPRRTSEATPLRNLTPSPLRDERDERNETEQRSFRFYPIITTLDITSPSLIEKAEQGDIATQYTLGSCYEVGMLGEAGKDLGKALEWSKAAANQGHMKARLKVGKFHANGRGSLAKNPIKAIKYFFIPADQGLVEAQFYLGKMLASGRPSQGKDVEAVSWYRKAADQNYVPAQHGLGKMYQQGRGDLPEDHIKAAYWFQKAVRCEYTKAYYRLGEMYEQGQGGLLQNDIKAKDLYHRAATKGYAKAQYKLGLMYEQGRGNLPVNSVEASLWYLRAADQEHSRAQARLRVMYSQGGVRLPREEIEKSLWFWRNERNKFPSTGFIMPIHESFLNEDQSPSKAAEIVSRCLKGAEAGLSITMYSLGVMYFEGKNVERNLDKAIHFFQKAAEKKHLHALYNLGVWSEKTRYNPVSDVHRFYLEAAMKGHIAAQYNVGVMYHLGRGVQKNNEEAIRWLRSSANREFEPAQFALRKIRAEIRENSPIDGTETTDRNLVGSRYANGQDGRPQDDGKAVVRFYLASLEGRKVAQYNLGVMYHAGRGVKKNCIEAIRWLWKAIDQEGESTQSNLYQNAYFGLGLIYATREWGVLSDHAQAVQCFREAANRGHPDAQSHLNQLNAQNQEELSRRIQNNTVLHNRTSQTQHTYNLFDDRPHINNFCNVCVFFSIIFMIFSYLI
ncbi:MAG: hypothetical protein BGO67_11115 [Alphaproteobacteria bacterium 41-28]|nr:MAG: hypothetical protein BGO67_11115 [Alphaproteobacteria bacterium 41-28]